MHWITLNNALFYVQTKTRSSKMFILADLPWSSKVYRVNLLSTIFFQYDRLSKTIDPNHESVTSFARTGLKLVCGYPHVREQETSSMHSRSIPQGWKEEGRYHRISPRVRPAIDRDQNFRTSNSGSNLKFRHASRSVTLPTRRPTDNNNSFPPKRALIMVRARAWAGKPTKRSFVEITTRASIAMLKWNHRKPSFDMKTARYFSRIVTWTAKCTRRMCDKRYVRKL